MKGQRSIDCDIDLGLAVSALSLQYGQTRTQDDIAAFCGCSRARIQQIEDKAMRRLKFKLIKCKDPVVRELLDHLHK